MIRTSRGAAAAVLAVTLLAATLLVGCTDDTAVESGGADDTAVESGGADDTAVESGGRSGAGPTTTASGSAEATGTELTWEVSLTSEQRILRQVGPGGSLNYGWNQLVGPTTLDGEPVQVEMLGNVDYRAGTGPFFGFVSLVRPDGDVLAFRMDGEATQPAGATGSSESTFTAELTVIGGTGAWAGATGGRGTFTGSRSAELGGTVVGTMTATIAGV